MTRRGDTSNKIAGSLLLAHPSLADPNFRRSVILLSAHTQEGALGVIINRPLGKTLSEISNDFALGELANVPVFSGGPVSVQQLILSAWEASEEDSTFKLYFGIDPEKASELKRESSGMSVRAYLGYAGWEGGQLEGELRDNAWVMAPVEGLLVRGGEGEGMWKTIIGRVNPQLRLQAEEPDEPELN